MPPEINQDAMMMEGPEGGMGIEELIAMIMQLLTTPPEQPGGELAGGGQPMGPPAFADTPDPQGAQLMQMLQMLQMAQSQSPQQGMNAVAGQQGGMSGFMGGRPVGS